VTDRDVRHFVVYLGEVPVLEVRDNPGTLRSSAAPPPEPDEPPPPPPDEPVPGGHPFSDAQAYDPVTEGRLRALLDESSSFDDYLARLLAAGFDIASRQPHEPVYDMPEGARLHDGDALVGAVWPRAGQYTSLRRQPAEGELVFDAGTLTAYAEDWAPRLLEALERAEDPRALLERLRGAGLRT
jgi:hypothetical protein